MSKYNNVEICCVVLWSFYGWLLDLRKCNKWPGMLNYFHVLFLTRGQDLISPTEGHENKSSLIRFVQDTFTPNLTNKNLFDMTARTKYQMHKHYKEANYALINPLIVRSRRFLNILKRTECIFWWYFPRVFLTSSFVDQWFQERKCLFMFVRVRTALCRTMKTWCTLTLWPCM